MLHHLVIAIRRYLNKLIPIPIPTLKAGEGELNTIATLLAEHASTKPLIVSDDTLKQLGIIEQLTLILDQHNVDYAVFDQVLPDPTVDLVQQGCTYFNEHHCDSIIALGGGSVIDCAKAIGASVTTKKSIKRLSGLFRIRKKLPTVVAIPTTAGTGSEATVVAVISEPINKQKFAVIDPVLVPKIAILDPSLMVGLPPNITAQTGLDALTHAIESYVGLHATGQTKAYSLDAIKRIVTHLPTAFHDGKNIHARYEMAIASYHAGIAFTRTSVGYVHAIAHQLGAYYHIPHGLANAVLLPHILDFSFDAAKFTYAEIAYETHIAVEQDSTDIAAQKFVEKVKQLLKTLEIQLTFDQLKVADINLLATRAIKEAYCDYPVPRVMTIEQCKDILERLVSKKD